MEDTLRADNAADFVDYLECLNPCFNGRYSQSIMKGLLLAPGLVLILVLMEDTLRVKLLTIMEKKNVVLILVLMEDTLRDSR